MKKIPAPTQLDIDTGWTCNLNFLQEIQEYLDKNYGFVDTNELDGIMEYLIKEGYLERP